MTKRNTERYTHKVVNQNKHARIYKKEGQKNLRRNNDGPMLQIFVIIIESRVNVKA